MKKLLALLLLSPLAFADIWENATETLNLEFLGRWFPNDTYIGLICSNEGSPNQKQEYYMMTLSLEEEKAIHLMKYTHSSLNSRYFNYDDWNKTYHEMHKNEKWANYMHITDSYISFSNPGFITIWRDKLEVDRTPCKKVSKDEMKEFGYKVEKIYQKHQKIIDDNYDRWLKKRKI